MITDNCSNVSNQLQKKYDRIFKPVNQVNFIIHSFEAIFLKMYFFFLSY